jgi:TatD DNase family protein
VIDTHAHIYAEEFDADRADVLQRAFDAGLDALYMPNVDHTSIDRMLEVEAKNPQRAFAMMGLHPCSVKKGFEKELYIVESWLQKRPFLAIGEIGTDLYWDKSTWAYQQEAFIQQIRWAKQYRMPVAIHCRESLADTLKLLEPFAGPDLSGVFHCFTGTLEQAKQCIALGFSVGIGGVSTFKNGGLDTVLPTVELNHVLLETDCPYLAPAPHRGKRNEPAYLSLIAQRVADLKKMPLAEVIRATTDNARKVFASPSRTVLS